MAGLAHDAGVVAARGQKEGYLGVGQEVQLVDRAPGCDVVSGRGDGEDRQPDVGQRDRPAVDLVAALGEVVAQEQAAQILRVHAKRHAREVGVPGHQVVHRLALAEQVVMDEARPDQVVRAHI